MKRIFIAIELPRDLKEKMIEVKNYFKNLPFRWVKPENIHLTLFFLGNLEDKEIENLKEICQNTISLSKSFPISFKRLGGFPDQRKIHTLWVGVEENNQLDHLYLSLASKLQSGGFQIEGRKFTPHITLARLKRGINLEKEIEKFKEKDFGKFLVTKVTLFASLLKASGPKHIPLGNFSLRG